MRWLTTRILFEKRWFIAGWSLAFGTMSSLIMMFYPSFSQSDGVENLTRSVPKQLQGFIGDPSVFASLDGFITGQVYDVRMSLLLIIMTTILAVSLTIREEEQGDLHTLLATPLSRDRIMIEKFFAALFIIGVLNLISTLGITLGIVALGETIPYLLLLQLGALSTLFGVVAFSIAFSLGLATGRRGVTLLISLTVAIGSYLLSTFARAVEWLQPWERFSLIHYYDTAGIREGSFENTNLWVFAMLLIVTLGYGLVNFRRRDIS